MKELKISDAKLISESSGFDEIVIFGYNSISDKQMIVTYGRTKTQCVDAASSGNYIKKCLGWDTSKCNTYPSKEIIDSKEEV